MNTKKTNKIRGLLWKLLFFAAVIILIFSFKQFLYNKERLSFLHNGNNNAFFKAMPEKYAKLVSQTPIDSVVDEGEIRAQRNC
ncbi:hypothetical protein [Flagellimonas pacifica]|uniref:Uncharacterized protein n=1 Tax=Flagellimonas pacifica TaxID=1247520 RepID=A0A285MD17_9FLAO|nr:hypothetical protein [Allomuricauda parva]SNY95029.1 hypothetical protein SAMN06265377_0695 [Allomuricauda parva]